MCAWSRAGARDLDGLTSAGGGALFAMGARGRWPNSGRARPSPWRAKATAALPAPAASSRPGGWPTLPPRAPPGSAPTRHAHLADLAQAVWEDIAVRVPAAPSGAGEEVERTLDPLGLVLKAGVWYLVARAQRSIRTYRVARITAVEHLAEPPTVPRISTSRVGGRTPSARFERSLRRLPVRVRLSAAGVRALPVVLDADLATSALDGARPGPEGWTETVIEFEAPDVAVGQLLALGTEVEVLEPASVRAGLRRGGPTLARAAADSPGALPSPSVGAPSPHRRVHSSVDRRRRGQAGARPFPTHPEALAVATLSKPFTALRRWHTPLLAHSTSWACWWSCR